MLLIIYFTLSFKFFLNFYRGTRYLRWGAVSWSLVFVAFTVREWAIIGEECDLASYRTSGSLKACQVISFIFTSYYSEKKVRKCDFYKRIFVDKVYENPFDYTFAVIYCDVTLELFGMTCPRFTINLILSNMALFWKIFHINFLIHK